MSPIAMRGARGCAARCSRATSRSTRITRSVPKRRQGRLGERRLTGSQVKNSGRSAGSRTPRTSLPAVCEPTASERRQRIGCGLGGSGFGRTGLISGAVGTAGSSASGGGSAAGSESA